LPRFLQKKRGKAGCDRPHLYQSEEKAFPGFFNYRLAKGASATLTIFLAL
jgi:hypothetical protein